MRLGDFEPYAVEAGARVRFALHADPSRGAIALPHPEVYTALAAGDRVSIDDGRLTGTVEHAQANTLEIRLSCGGI